MTGEPRRRKARGHFRNLLCTLRGPGPTSLTKDNAEPCGGCIILARNPSVTGAAEFTGTSLVRKMRARGVQGGEEPMKTTKTPSSYFNVATKMSGNYGKLEEEEGEKNKRQKRK